MDFVVDASVAMGWLLQSQADDLSVAAEQAVAEGAGWVPAHFTFEVARSLRALERRKLIAPEVVDGAFVRLRGLPLIQDSVDPLVAIDETIALARRHTLRIADAAYLELALRLQLPLATRDRTLASTARNAGATLFGA